MCGAQEIMKNWFNECSCDNDLLRQNSASMLYIILKIILANRWRGS
jgi:hypothetical protein